MEKQNFREMLLFLTEQGYPNTLTVKETAKAIGASYNFTRDLVRKGKIKLAGGKVPIGQIASYLCG